MAALYDSIGTRPEVAARSRAVFNEVFFTDVRVPDNQRLGNVGDGWKVSLTTLMNERLAVGDAPGPDFDDIFVLARSLELDVGPAIRNPAVREKLADWYVKTVGPKYTKFRTMTALSRGQTPGLKRRSPNWSAPASCRRLPPMASTSWE